MIRCAAKQGALPAPMQRRAPGQTALPPGAQAALPHKPGNPVLATAMTQRWRATWTSSFSADSSAWSWQSLFSCFSLIDSAICLDAPLREDFFLSPRFAASAAPAAICCFFDFAGISNYRSRFRLRVCRSCVLACYTNRGTDHRVALDDLPVHLANVGIEQSFFRADRECLWQARFTHENSTMSSIGSVRLWLPSSQFSPSLRIMNNFQGGELSRHPSRLLRLSLKLKPTIKKRLNPPWNFRAGSSTRHTERALFTRCAF
jgi:hypothetical protein